MVKKYISMFLCTLLLFWACGGVTHTGEANAVRKPLRVLVDLAGGLGLVELESQDALLPELNIDSAIKNWLPNVQKVTGIEDIELEFLPREGAERSSRMTHLRTEMMAGQGPDVFIMANTLEYNSRTDRIENVSFFLMPEKSMNLGLFYPLDDFIENAQYMEWDKLNQKIMAAGYNETYGQVLLPLCYELPLTLFPKQLVEHTPSTERTWEDMLNDGTGIMQAASSFLNGHEFPLYPGTETFGQLADYKNRKLLFAEEELLQRYQELKEMDDKQTDGSFDSLPIYFKTTTDWRLTRNSAGASFGPYGSNDYPILRYDDFLKQEISEEPSPFADAGDADTEVTMIPVYSDDGGVTAMVRAFAAINANSRRAQDAFAVLDYLFSEQCMRDDSEVYSVFGNAAVPVQDYLMEKTLRTIWHGDLEPANFEEFRRVTDCITTVTFADTISLELRQAFWKLLCIDQGRETGDPAEIVHEIYTRMKRELSE